MKIFAFLPLLGPLLVVFAMAACDQTTSVGGFTGTPAIRIAGTWRYTGGVGDNEMTASCQIRGTASLNQNNDQFNGAIQGVQNCLFGAGETTEDPLWGGVAQGEIGGESVRFTSMGCLHTGTISGSPANHMAGASTCSFSIPPETKARTFVGTWEATRQ